MKYQGGEGEGSECKGSWGWTMVRIIRSASAKKPTGF